MQDKQANSIPQRGWSGWACRLLEHRRLALILAISAVVATLPALRTGLLNDDLHHWAIMGGAGRLGDELSDLGFAGEDSGRLGTAMSEQFGPLDPEHNLSDLKNYGALPWWTYDDLRVRFWRPLSTLTHWLDYRLFGDSPVVMHAHNLLWLGAVIFLLAMLYRRLMAPAWIAGLAAVMYAIDDSGYFPAMWIANRNVFISLFFGILTLLAHHRWRRDGSTGAGIASVVCLAGSLLAAEAGVATCAYLFAYALVLDRGSLVRRGLSLAPAALLTVSWRLIYNALGHGASGSSFYSDPSREPLRYAWAVLVRSPILLMRQWTGIPADLFSYMPETAKLVFWPVIMLAAVVILLILLPLLRASRMARFWIVGMHLCILPVCATMPMNRNLLFVGIGTCGLIAQFVGGFAARESWVPKSGVRRVSTLVLFVIVGLAHLPFAALARVTAPLTTSMLVGKVQETMEIDSSEEPAGQDLMIINAPNPASFFYIPFLCAYEGGSLPRGIRVLAPGFGPLEIARQSDKALSVRAESGNLLSCRPSRMLDMDWAYMFEAVSALRSEGERLRRGERIELRRMSVEIVEVDDGGMPVEVLFTFDVPLEDASLKWVWWKWKRDRYEPFEVPAIGERIRVKGPL